MFTVLRITSSKENIKIVKAIGNEMNVFKPGIFTVIRKAGDGFCFEISTSDFWYDHVIGIKSTANVFKNILCKYRDLGINVTFDTAIEKHDFNDRSLGLFIHHDSELINLLHESGAEMETSIYINMELLYDEHSIYEKHNNKNAKL